MSCVFRDQEAPIVGVYRLVEDVLFLRTEGQVEGHVSYVGLGTKNVESFDSFLSEGACLLDYF